MFGGQTPRGGAEFGVLIGDEQGIQPALGRLRTGTAVEGDTVAAAGDQQAGRYETRGRHGAPAQQREPQRRRHMRHLPVT
ncbi:hypothetical protein ACIP6V_06690 [Streptomyces sp. NPDC088770]|uniref:hypothetical protein n=1 Tax=unclassified Streptomyces TaxID=2593676 RepID=UPI003805DA7E